MRGDEQVTGAGGKRAKGQPAPCWINEEPADFSLAFEVIGEIQQGLRLEPLDGARTIGLAGQPIAVKRPFGTDPGEDARCAHNFTVMFDHQQDRRPGFAPVGTSDCAVARRELGAQRVAIGGEIGQPAPARDSQPIQRIGIGHSGRAHAGHGLQIRHPVSFTRSVLPLAKGDGK